MWANVLAWIDSYQLQEPDDSEAIAWGRVLPLIALHVIGLVGLFLFPLSVVDLSVAVLLYLIRMFAITGFFHRYFSHKAFATARWHQFLWAFLGTTATQRGPLWWAAHHRHHHQHTETERDPHNARRGFWWSHMGWFLSPRHFATDKHAVRDFARFPELVWLDRFDVVPPIVLAALLYLIGVMLEHFAPASGTTGLQLVFWGYLVSTLVLMHVTLMINSLAHKVGSRPYDNDDDSRNSWWLALLTLGEGWHNNHHRYCGSARQGFLWWEVDVSYYVLRGLARLGLVWDLREVPAPVLAERSGRQS